MLTQPAAHLDVDVDDVSRTGELAGRRFSSFRSTYAALLLTILCADALGLAIAAAFALALRNAADWRSIVWPAVFCSLVWVALGLRAGLYRQTVVRVALLDVPYIVSTMLQGSGLVLALSAVMGGSLARISLLGTFVLVAIPCRVAMRVLSQALVRYLGTGSRSRLLIIGSGQVVAQRLAALLIKYRNLGVTVVGFVDDSEYDEGTRQILALPVYHSSELDDVLTGQKVDHVVFAFSRQPDSAGISLLRACQKHANIQISLVPRLFEVMPARSQLLDIHGIPLLQFDTSGRQVELACKRLLDIVVSALGLVVTFPFVLIAALAIRLEGSGPVLFRQRRIGRDGRPFIMYKLRSMRERRDDEAADAASRHTRVGRFIRKLSIDELPQFWNVLRGDMSLVGPRPEQERYVALFNERIPRYAERHRMRGGITGLSQINQWRGDSSFIERTRLDNFYIDNWSLWLDIKIMLLTFTALIPTHQGIGGEAMFRDVVAEVSLSTNSAAGTATGARMKDPDGSGSNETSGARVILQKTRAKAR